MLTFVDGQLNDSIAVNDRGLAYGDGCFTTALVQSGKVMMLEQHIKRLTCQSQQLGLPNIDSASLEKSMIEVGLQIDFGVVKVIVTCGSGGRGYSRVGVEKSKVIICVHEYPQHYLQWQLQGINVGISELKLGINPMLAGLKHLNRLEQVLLRAELDKRTEDDLIATDINGSVIECCSANVFWMTEGQWYTPSLKTAGVAGLMRAKVLEKNRHIELGNFTLEHLENIDAMFITNAILGIVPVNIFNTKPLDIALVDSIKK